MTPYRIPQFLEKAFSKDFVYTDEGGLTFSFYSFDLGNLKITNGAIVACDPFLYNHDAPFEQLFPVGEFPVQLAIARVNTDERLGFARISFSDQHPVAWKMALCEGQDLSTMKADEIFGFGVDTGTAAFMDISGAEALYGFLSKEENNFNVLIDEMHKHYKDTWDWLLWEKNDANAAMFSSGWGDGYYASYVGTDANGGICRLVMDFAIVDG